MGKLISYFTRHIAVSAATLALILSAVIGSAYGFTKIREITSLGANLPQVKTVAELADEKALHKPLPTNAEKSDDYNISRITPTRINTKQDEIKNSPSSNGQNPVLVTPQVTPQQPTVTILPPLFEEDHEIEEIEEEEDHKIEEIKVEEDHEKPKQETEKNEYAL